MPYKDLAKRLAQQRAWRAANSEKLRVVNRARARAWRAANLERARERGREYNRRQDPKKKAAIDKKFRETHRQAISDFKKADYIANQAERQAQQRERKRRKQEAAAGRPKPVTCEICGDMGVICWDHCHNSGAFRGWICQPCNSALGMVRDSPHRLQLLINYLRDNDSTLAVAA